MTGANAKIKRIYVGENLVRPVWKPGANTIAYYPLNGDANDYSGNNRNLTATNIIYQDITSDKKSAYFNGSSSFCENSLGSLGVSQCTISFRLKKARSAANERFVNFFNTSPNSEVGVVSYNNSNLGNIGETAYVGDWIFYAYNDTGVANLNWMYVCFTVDTSSNKLFQNGNQLALTYDRGNANTGLSSSRIFTKIVLGRHNNGSLYFQGNMSDIIIENKVRTAQEILDYYNQTKGNYGL